MPALHLRQPGFTYSACVPFTKNKGRFMIFLLKETTIFSKKFLEKPHIVSTYIVRYVVWTFIRPF